MTEMTEATIERMNRRNFVTRLGAAGLGVVAGAFIAGCGGGGNSSAGASTNTDQDILNAAATAEALATVMYYNIITIPGSIYQVGLANNAPDKAYLVAGYEEELNHYNFLVAHGGKPLATTFYFPTNMFTDPQTTVNTLVTLEDAFIAAYLIGVNDFSSNGLKVIAGQILGVESEHRALARVITNDLNLSAATGLAGSESIVPPTATSNNLAYERMFFTTIAQVVSALGPFVTPGHSGFSATAYPFATAAAAAPSAGQPLVQLANTSPSQI